MSRKPRCPSDTQSKAARKSAEMALNKLLRSLRAGEIPEPVIHAAFKAVEKAADVEERRVACAKED